MEPSGQRPRGDAVTASLAAAVAVDRGGRRLFVAALASAPGMAVVTSRDSNRWAVIELPSNVDGNQRAALERYARRAADDLFAMEPFRRPDSPIEHRISNLFLHINDVCNLRCRHCYALREGQDHALVGSARGTLGVADVERMVDELEGFGLARVTLGGGEPVLHPELGAIIRTLHRRGLGISLLTNATRISESLAALLAEAGVVVLASLHGPDAATHGKLSGPGSFAPAVAGIRRLRSHLGAQQVVINSTLWDGNVTRIPDTIRLAEELGAGSIRFMPLHGFMRAGDHGHPTLTCDSEDVLHWARLAARMRVERGWKIEVGVSLTGIPGATCEDVDGGVDRVCAVGRELIVAADGGVFACPLLMQAEHRLGSIADGLGAIARSAQLLGLERTVARRREAVAACGSCALSGICQGGCPALAYDAHATFDACDPMCKAHREYSDELFSRCASSR